MHAAATDLATSGAPAEAPLYIPLQPPKLSAEHLGTRVLCHRPVRTGGPYMKIEQRGTTSIVHNYGHGGDGWTLAPGCVQHLIDQFHAQVDVPKEEPIVVIGAGVVGLLTAYMLHTSGHSHITVVAEQFEDLTSHKAGGFCAPTGAQESDPVKKELMHKIGIASYKFYEAVARGQKPDVDAMGAWFMHAFLMPGDQRLAAWEDDVMQKPTSVLVQFPNKKRPYQMKLYKDAIFLDTHRLMASLLLKLKSHMLSVKQRVESFDEISARCIFNCAGLGAQDLKALDDDAPMVPGQGHLIMLKNQDPYKIDYIIGFKGGSGITKDGRVVHHSVYMFPKQTLGAPETSIGVLGGTYIEDADATTPHEEQFDLMVERARYFFGQ
jgi:glycine/D-amino acid oxidase-like deaminating enzyme